MRKICLSRWGCPAGLIRLAGAMRAVAISLGVFLCAIAAMPADAQDFVTVRINPGYPIPSASAEFVSLSVTRVPAAVPGSPQDADQYFKAVGDQIREGKVPAKWSAVMVDAPSINVDIRISGATYAYASTYGSQGLVLGANASADDKRVAGAMQKILALTIEHAKGRFIKP